MRRFLLLLLLSATAGAQTLASRPNPGAETDALTRAKSGMKQYLEDLTERTVAIRLTISEFDRAGNPPKVEHHDRRLKGTRLRRTDVAFAPAANISADRRLLFFEFVHDAALYPAAIVLTAENYLDYAVDTATTEGDLHVHYQSRERCLDVHADSQHISASWCGAGDMTFDAATGLPKFVAFAATGMSQELKHGGWILRGWRAEQTFQSLVPPGEANSITLPKTLKTTFETDKGNIVFESVYTLAPEKKK